MKVVIDIDENVYTRLFDNGVESIAETDMSEIAKTMRNGEVCKTGHWIKYGSSRCEEQHYQCTSCGYYINFGSWGDVYTKQFKYCPNCSARMNAEE